MIEPAVSPRSRPTRLALARERRPRRCKLALFDLDGVLVDSRDAMERAWSAVQRDVGVTTPFADYFREIGRPFPEILARLGLAARAVEIERAYRAAAGAEAPRVRSFAGVRGALRQLARDGTKIGVVTSKALPLTLETLAQFDVDFATVQTPDRGPGKPAPFPLLLAVSEARADVRDAVFVGDMAVDWEAARNAGMGFLHAAWGYGARPRGAAQLRHPREIAALGARGGAG